jgi:hypothetical protein
MYVFDLLGRLHPLSLHYFCLASSYHSTEVPIAKKKQQKILGHSLTDRFFCTYLARYLNIPFYFFEIYFDTTPWPTDLHGVANSTNLKHFSLYLDKNEAPNQEKVKHWIRQVYR